MKTSEHIGQLVAALAEAQKTIVNPAFDKVNPHFKSKYATLGAHLDVIREPFSRNGLVLTQFISSDNTSITCTTRISHKSGEWMEDSASEGRPERCTIQQFGSICSYLRRYTIAAAVGIVGEESDDDGEAAVAPQRMAQQFSRPVQQQAPAPQRPVQQAPAPQAPAQQAPAPAPAPAAKQDDGEWVWIDIRFCDEKQSQGKTASPYLAIKTADDQRLTCWDTALFPVLKEAATSRKTIGVIIDTSTKFPKIVEVRNG